MEYTQKQIDDYAKEIENMRHYEMCRVWRFGSPLPLTRKDLINTDGKSLGDIFSDRLFKHFGGFTPEISKSLSF